MDQLLTKGYTVVSNFLTPQEVGLFVEDFNAGNSSSKSLNVGAYEMVNASTTALKTIYPKITAILKQCGLPVDLILPGGMYTNTKTINLGWHQDHTSYYIFQQHTNYLNFFIGLVKPDQQRTGLTVVPLDRLQQLIPNHIQYVLNKGAAQCFVDGDVTTLVSDDTGETITLPINIESIAESPAFGEGDLLLLRGDVLHRTQDTSTYRVALSVRCTDSTAPMSIDKMLSGNQTKLDVLASNPQMVAKIKSKFDQYNSTTITAGQYFTKWIAEGVED